MRESRLPEQSGICRCGACGQWFGSLSAFDLHWKTGTHGMRLDAKGRWRFPAVDASVWAAR